MRTALFIALISVAACHRHDKVIVVDKTQPQPPNVSDVDPTAPIPAGNPRVPPVAAASVPATLPTTMFAPLPTEIPVESSALPPERNPVDAGVDGNDSHGLVPEGP